MDTSTILTIGIIILGVYIFLKILSAPLKLAVKLMLHGAVGFVLLLVAEFICGFFDFSLGINLVKCVAAGILGIPGVIILVVLRIFTGI